MFRVRTPPIQGPGKVCFCATKTVLCYKTPCLRSGLRGGSAPKSLPDPIRKTNPMNRPKKTPAPEMRHTHQSFPEAKRSDRGVRCFTGVVVRPYMKSDRPRDFLLFGLPVFDYTRNTAQPEVRGRDSENRLICLERFQHCKSLSRRDTAQHEVVEGMIS